MFTGYKQRTHDSELLGNLAGEQHALMVDLLPKTAPDDKHLFDLLKKAYIDARYSMSYRITSEELAELQRRVLMLADRVRSACLEQIATFCGADAMRKDGMKGERKVFATERRRESRLARRKAEGIQVGEEKGLRDALLTILRARGVGIPAELEQRIRGCVDGELLAKWLVRAATATRVSDLDEDRAFGS